MAVEKVLVSVFVAVESAHGFSAFCPSLFTIKTFADTEEKKKAVRLGYIPAVIFSLILGYVCSRMIKSWLPLVLAGATATFMILSYEFALRSGG